MRFFYEVDLALSKILGIENSCLRKVAHKTRTAAQNAANKNNELYQKGHRHHEVRVYECGKCGDYHTGRKWHIDDIRMLFNEQLSEEENELLEPMLEEWAKT